MKIRSITCFIDPIWPLDAGQLAKAGEFVAAARPAFETAGYEVQSTRLATTPFSRYAPSLESHALVELAQAFEAAAGAHGFEYISLGPALPDSPESYTVIPEILGATQSLFVTGLMTLPNGGVSLPAVRACADVIQRASGLSPDGFTNLRFAALANVPPGTPFLPAAYYGGTGLAFALATESADLAVEAFQGASSLEDARQALVTSVETQAAELERTAFELIERFEVSFGGIDFTLAPFPRPAISFGAAVEQMGVPAVGWHGSLAAAAILADTLDRAEFHRVGFNGLMLPVLEDSVLAQRAAQGVLSVKDLLLMSTVCGTGLDCVPLPGDTTVDQLYAVLLDLAVLSQRLDKPLTARLLPIPGKQAGDPTGFDFTYFANSKVLPLEADPLEGLLHGAGSFSVRPRIR